METQLNLFEKLCKEETLYEAWKFVRSKNAAGGIDGITLNTFEEKLHVYIGELTNQLQAGTWAPEPYFGIEIPKNKNEVRKLGLLSVKDKIVQYAIKLLVEPLFENIFVDNSYGYRPNKGHTKAVRRTLNECMKKKNKWVLRLDIDNYFDTINHHLLAAQIYAVVPDEEIVRLIMLSVQMGIVNKQLKWHDSIEGVPQGAILSPLLANLYLHSFDKFVLKYIRSYVRYSDDFIILCESQDQARSLLVQTSTYLQSHLGLNLNPHSIIEIWRGFEFLGIFINKERLSISERKQEDLKVRIDKLQFTPKGFTRDTLLAWNAVRCYYGVLLSQEILRNLDGLLYDKLKKVIIEESNQIANRTMLERIMSEVSFLSSEYQLYKRRILQEYIEIYNLQKGIDKERKAQEQNKKIIEQRKKEYRKREVEGTELLINTFGCFIGLSGKGITVKQKGKVIYQKMIGSLSHITISSKGVTISSNLIDYCLANKISIDFFNSSGAHTGSVLSNKYIESTLWNKQAQCGMQKRMILATLIIGSKLKNQLNLIKYFHKYHKHYCDTLSSKYGELLSFYDSFKTFMRVNKEYDEKYVGLLVGFEAQGALKYWAYIKELLADDKVDFNRRERKGATDLVNCMLNYGYAILYSRVWQALLGAKLNPFDSIIHVRQPGKPTFVFDVIEMFRSQVVDRVVISLIQKGGVFKIEKGLLEEKTKKMLSKCILERLNRYEKYKGEEVTMEQIIRYQAREIANWIDTDQIYKPYVAKW